MQADRTTRPKGDRGTWTPRCLPSDVALTAQDRAWSPVMDPDTLFDDLAAELAPRGVAAGAMFGKRALKANGTAFACLKNDVLAVKLGDGTREHTAALALAGSELFDPSGK